MTFSLSLNKLCHFYFEIEVFLLEIETKLESDIDCFQIQAKSNYKIPFLNWREENSVVDKLPYYNSITDWKCT